MSEFSFVSNFLKICIKIISWESSNMELVCEFRSSKKSSMAKNNFFQFKQFKVFQEKAAMKVGIDGVLLGAWANINGAARVLDVGTGTGLLALMAAQRSTAIVDAVELEEEAASEALLNFENSAWQSRIKLFLCAFQNYETNEKYDHVISNPPYFNNSLQSPDSARSLARHSDSLSIKELIEKSKVMLSEVGKISLILPSESEHTLRGLADELGMFISRFCLVYPDELKKGNRILVELSLIPEEEKLSKIYIREKNSSSFTHQYKELTRDFYLGL